MAYSHILVNDIASGLRITSKTAARHLYKLIELNWIGYDKRTNILHVRNKNNILPKCKRKTSAQVVASHKSLKHFSEFLLSALIGYMIKRKRNARNMSVLKYDGTFRDEFPGVSSFPDSYQIALRYISKATGKTVSWVEKYKKRAMKLGIIERVKCLKETGVLWQDRELYFQHCTPKSGEIFEFDGWLYLRSADALKVNLRYKRKKVHNKL